MIIAVAGKGGVGKSTVAALAMRHFIRGRVTPVLAVDADPNSNLGDKLGLKVDFTVGELREDALQQKYTAPMGVPKQRSVEYEAEQTVGEGTGFDLVVMGRGEGPGCYCSVNNMLRMFLQRLSGNYKHVIVDNEAGMEHLSRRTNDKVDLLLVICDPTPPGLQAARRIAELAAKLDVVRGEVRLIVNRVTEPFTSEEAAAATGVQLCGCIPDDPLVREFELQGRPLLDLPSESAAVTAVGEIVESLGA